MADFLSANIPPDDVELIESYLRGDLTEHEEARFEERLKREPELAQLLRSVQVLSLAARQSYLDNLRKQLRHLEDELDVRENPSRTRKSRPLFLVTIALALAIVAILIGLILKADASPDALFSQHYDPMSDITEKFRSATDHQMAPGVEYMETGRYERAAKQYLIAFEKTRDTTCLYYAAIAFTGAGKTQKAENLLEQSQDSAPEEGVHLYRALILVRKSDPAAARQYILTQYPEDRPPRIDRLFRALTE